MPAYAMLFVTCPDAQVAEAIARRLVDERLAACGSVTSPVTSVYRWRGEVHGEAEVVLLLKTRHALVPACTKAIRALHPYDLPEIVEVPILGGLREYLAWIGAETAARSPARRRR